MSQRVDQTSHIQGTFDGGYKMKHDSWIFVLLTTSISLKVQTGYEREGRTLGGQRVLKHVGNSVVVFESIHSPVRLPFISDPVESAIPLLLPGKEPLPSSSSNPAHS